MQTDRRGIIKLLSACAVALIGRPAEAQQKPEGKHPCLPTKDGDTTCITVGDFRTLPPPAFFLTLDGFGGFVIRNNDKQITLTPEEVWKALGGE